MSLDAKRWALIARELSYHQLDAARRQAEAWRTGLASMTALLGAVLVIKGRSDLANLAENFRWLVVGLLATSLAAFVAATFLAVRAAAGRPEEQRYLTDSTVRMWTRNEVEVIGRSLRWAMVLAIAGVSTLGIAVGCAWLGPSQVASSALIEVMHTGGRTCGVVVSGDGARLLMKCPVRGSGDTYVAIPLSTIQKVNGTNSC